MKDKLASAHEVLGACIESAEDQGHTFDIGQRVGGDPADELQHFYLCAACGQPVDKRDLGAVFHHEEPGHEPMSTEDAERLIRISAALNATLAKGVANS